MRKSNTLLLLWGCLVANKTFAQAQPAFPRKSCPEPLLQTDDTTAEGSQYHETDPHNPNRAIFACHRVKGKSIPAGRDWISLCQHCVGHGLPHVWMPPLNWNNPWLPLITIFHRQHETAHTRFHICGRQEGDFVYETTRVRDHCPDGEPSKTDESDGPNINQGDSNHKRWGRTNPLCVPKAGFWSMRIRS